MNKRVTAAMTALLLLITTICFPVLSVYATGLDSDSVTEDVAEDTYSDIDASDDLPDEDEQESGNNTEQDVDTEQEAESVESEAESFIEPDNDEDEELDPVHEEETQASNLADDELDMEDIGNSLTSVFGLELDENVVYSLDDLKEWITGHWVSGGTVEFGCDITIPENESALLACTRSKALINTGEFGLIVQGSLEISDIAIIGSGTSRPVIEVMPGGELHIEASTQSREAITSTEDNGRVIYIHEGGKYSSALNSTLNLRTEGSNSVALESEMPLDLSYVFIEASGSGSVGIVCTQPVSLYLCKISGEGSSVQAPRVNIDTSIVMPAPNNIATEINRKITKLTNAEYKGPIGENSGLIFGGRTRIFATLDADGAEEPDEVILWSILQEFEIDYNQPGIHYIDLKPEWPYSDFDLISEQCPLQFAVYLNDYSQKPFFIDAGYNSRQRRYLLNYKYTGDMDKLTLWRSDDNGDAGYIYDDADMTFDGENIVIALTEAELMNKVSLVFETEDYGDSEVLCFYTINGNLVSDRGGDRNGGDRGKNTLPKDSDGETSTTNPGDEANDPPPTVPDDGTPTNPGADPTEPGGGTPESGDDTGDPPPADPGNGTQENTDGRSGGDGDTSTTNRDNIDKQIISDISASADAEVPVPSQAAPILTAKRPGEYSDERSITVSGERLAVMIEANPESVSFTRDELCASIPAAYLKSLSLNPADTFSVTLYRPDERSFAVSFAVNKVELTGVFDEPFIISLPWSGGPVSCSLADGEAADATLDDGTASFALYKTGTYILTEQALEAVAIIQKTNSPIAADISKTNLLTDDQPQALSYSDSWAKTTVIIVISLAGFGLYLLFTRKRAVRRL